jgi:5-methylcytosine-specific restriction endonuclease McrA
MQQRTVSTVSNSAHACCATHCSYLTCITNLSALIPASCSTNDNNNAHAKSNSVFTRQNKKSHENNSNKKALEPTLTTPTKHSALPTDRTIDHVIPLTRHGAHTPDNLVAACNGCQNSRGNKLINEWFACKNNAKCLSNNTLPK